MQSLYPTEYYISIDPGIQDLTDNDWRTYRIKYMNKENCGLE